MTTDVLNNIVRKALTARLVEEKLLNLFSEGYLSGTVHTCIGQEFSGAIISEFLKQDDTIFSNHRCHGHFLSITHDIDGLIAELMGKSTGVSGGRGGSQHLYKNGFFSSGIQGGFLPVCTGLALGHKFNKKNNISVAFIGDGTLGEGAIYESFNIASKWKLPLLVVLEDNGFAQSTEKKETLAGSILGRAESFDLMTEEVSIWNLDEFYKKAEAFINKIRDTQTPGFLVVNTFRLKAHSKGDDNRDPNLVKKYFDIDPLNVWSKQNQSTFDKWTNEISVLVDAAAEKAKLSDIEPLLVHDKKESNEALQWSPLENLGQRLVKSLNGYFTKIFSEDKKVVFIGEDIKSPYGGAFKVTQGLSDIDSNRVFNTPISESAIVGIGTGLAILGYKPVVEIMFGDFMTLTFDQIVNHASKFYDMYNKQVTCPVIIRTPMGGRRGYGPTHSQSLEKHFLGIPGLNVLALNPFLEPDQIYSSLFNQNQINPTLVIENKTMYAKQMHLPEQAGYQFLKSNEVFPTVVFKPISQKIDVTIVGYGGMSEFIIQSVQQLFEKYDIIAQALILSNISDIEISKYADILKRSENIVLTEEGVQYAGFSAEVASQIAEANQTLKIKNIKRVYSKNCSIPASQKLEEQMLASENDIIDACLEITRNAN